MYRLINWKALNDSIPIELPVIPSKNTPGDTLALFTHCTIPIVNGHMNNNLTFSHFLCNKADTNDVIPNELVK